MHRWNELGVHEQNQTWKVSLCPFRLKTIDVKCSRSVKFNMTVGNEACIAFCSVGQFASIFVTLLQKKVVKTAREVQDTEVKCAAVRTQRCFFAWLLLSAMLLFSSPFSVHMVLCGEVYTAKHRMYDRFRPILSINLLYGNMFTAKGSFRPILITNLLCSYILTDFRLLFDVPPASE